MSKVAIIGAGASGVIAGISAALHGHEVYLYEKNEKIGKKLYITGKGRCNVTNASDMRTVMDNVVTNPKFLYSAFKNFTNEDIMNMIEEAGCKLKVERGNRVFPISDKSSDVIKALDKMLKDYGINLFLDTEVENLFIKEKVCKGIIINKQVMEFDAVIVATGGFSYKTTGSTGDGYKFAKSAGHKVTKLYQSLVPFNISEDTSTLQGLSLKNVSLSIYNKDKCLYNEFGEMLFTHFGISGPLVLSASSYVVREFERSNLKIKIDLKPALTKEKLDERILRDFNEFKNKNLKNALVKLVPLKLIPIIIDKAGLDEKKEVNSLSKEERLSLVDTIKELTFVSDGVRGYNEAIITKGGIDVSEINPKTMESKLIKGLYFVGEVLDLDALTGGYNLQIAWSTGYSAGGGIEYV